MNLFTELISLYIHYIYYNLIYFFHDIEGVSVQIHSPSLWMSSLSQKHVTNVDMDFFF